MELDLDGEHAELEKKSAHTFCAKERAAPEKRYNSNHAHMNQRARKILRLSVSLSRKYGRLRAQRNSFLFRNSTS